MASYRRTSAVRSSFMPSSSSLPPVVSTGSRLVHLLDRPAQLHNRVGKVLDLGRKPRLGDRRANVEPMVRILEVIHSPTHLSSLLLWALEKPQYGSAQYRQRQ